MVDLLTKQGYHIPLREEPAPIQRAFSLRLISKKNKDRISIVGSHVSFLSYGGWRLLL